jgi:hypothetical protein|nr:hypothetical protein [uncultured Brevundimonas sp.]
MMDLRLLFVKEGVAPSLQTCKRNFAKSVELRRLAKDFLMICKTANG